MRIVANWGMNDADYPVKPLNESGGRDWCPFYKVWFNMVNRAHHSTAKAYEGVTVDERWKVFSDFRTWMESQDWDGKSLDKDLLPMAYGLDQKLYSPDTCVFVTHEVNMFASTAGSPRTTNHDLPRGISRNRNKYQTSYLNHKSEHHLKPFVTESLEEAVQIYTAAKEAHLRALIASEQNPVVQAALSQILLTGT